MALFDFLSVKQTREGAVQRMKELQQEQAELSVKLRAFDAALIARSDLRVAVDAWVDRQRQAFSIDAGTVLSKLLDQPPASLLRGGQFLDLQMARIFGGHESAGHARAAAGAQGTEGLSMPFMCSLFGDEIRAHLHATIDSLQYEEGLSAAARPAAREKLSQRMREINTEIEDLRTKAADAGIKL